jgi:glucan phosphoethanolaminetransferase (alkaline phosphatase superfamily)
MTIERLLKSVLRINVLKLALLAIPLALPLRVYAARFAHLGEWKLQLIYLLLFALCIGSTVAAAFIVNSYGRIFCALLFGSFMTFWTAYQAILHAFMTYDAFITMLHARGFIGDAFSQFMPEFIKSILVGLTMFAGIALAPEPRKRRPLPDMLTWALAPAVIAGIASIAYARGGDGLQGLPGNDTVAAYLVLLGIESSHSEVAPRERVTLASIPTKPDYDVVLIVDESVRGDFLDVGTATGIKSNLLGANAAVHNFGLAASGNNCSEGSNMLLRFGGTRDDYRSTTDHKPSMFHYAKSRGFHTVYVDGQRNGKRLQNGMDAYELSAIDEFIQFDDVKVVDRDIRIAELIAARTRNHVPEFIYVNKVGAHFPVQDKFPDSFMRYTPALPRGTYASVADAAVRPSDLAWERYNNSYRNTLLWNVGEFFRIVLANADLDHAFLLYTSDHGEDFGQNQATFKLHCSTDPAPIEGLVPLVILTGLPGWSDKARDGAARNFNHSSHYNIFPTMLAVMGYSDPQVLATYGPSLFEETHDPMTFNYRYYARLGQPPLWKRVEIKEPQQDHAAER